MEHDIHEYVDQLKQEGHVVFQLLGPEGAASMKQHTWPGKVMMVLHDLSRHRKMAVPSETEATHLRKLFCVCRS